MQRGHYDQILFPFSFKKVLELQRFLRGIQDPDGQQIRNRVDLFGDSVLIEPRAHLRLDTTFHLNFLAILEPFS